MKYRRARQAAWRKIADETVLLDLEGKRMYGLNPAAAAVWQALDPATGIDQLARMTAGGGRPAFGASEIEAFLGELVALGLAEAQSLTAAADPERGDVDGSAPDPGLEALEPPAILWHEDVEQIAGTCAMFPSQNPLCNQVPFS